VTREDGSAIENLAFSPGNPAQLSLVTSSAHLAILREDGHEPLAAGDANSRLRYQNANANAI